MKSITTILSEKVSDAFSSCGFDREYGVVVFSKTSFCQFQCNGSLAAAKEHKISPLTLAEQVRLVLVNSSYFLVDIVKPGFININLTDDFIAEYTLDMLGSSKLGLESNSDIPFRIVIDYGGPNVAKPLHVGHLRSAIIGESIKNIARFIGHTVIGDIHLGDWGLQMGMVMAMLKRARPQLNHLLETKDIVEIAKFQVSIDELEHIYPEASALSKSDAVFLNEARAITADLQKGDICFTTLWKNIVSTSVKDLESNYSKLGITFDIWMGESDSQTLIPGMVEGITRKGYARVSDGALVVDVCLPGDTSDIPPLILYKSDGASLYSTTDLATILQRREQFTPDYIFYVVDKRQSTHFKQVFRAAYMTGVAPKDLKLEFVPFGTMNGKDGRPFKTRSGGVMKLRSLVDMLVTEAEERLQQVSNTKMGIEERFKVAEFIGMASLKFGDLINSRESDYIFDIDKFISFEGRTGPYLLYSVVRIKSILAKAKELDILFGEKIIIGTNVERQLLLKIMESHDVILSAFDRRLPSLIAEYVYNLSNIYNSFYHEIHVLNEIDDDLKSSRLTVISLSLVVMETCLGLLGISTVDRM